jgi:hypothetical protein
MTQAELRRLAQLGAESRLEALQREIASIHHTFPDLRQRRSSAAANPYTAGVRSAVAGVREALEGAVTRRRPKMSTQARKRIAEAQRKRWAEWRANQAKAAETQTASKAKAGSGARKKK